MNRGVCHGSVRNDGVRGNGSLVVGMQFAAAEGEWLRACLGLLLFAFLGILVGVVLVARGDCYNGACSREFLIAVRTRGPFGRNVERVAGTFQGGACDLQGRTGGAGSLDGSLVDRYGVF